MGYGSMGLMGRLEEVIRNGGFSRLAPVMSEMQEIMVSRGEAMTCSLKELYLY